MLRPEVKSSTKDRWYFMMLTRLTLRPAHRSVDVLGGLSFSIPLAHLSIDARPALLLLPILVQGVRPIAHVREGRADHRGPPLDWLALRLVHLI